MGIVERWTFPTLHFGVVSGWFASTVSLPLYNITGAHATEGDWRRRRREGRCGKAVQVDIMLTLC